MVLCASAAISKAMRNNSLSPDLSFGFRERKRARYSLRISFFSWSSVRLYFGIAATASMLSTAGAASGGPGNTYEFTKKTPYFCSLYKAETAGVAKLADAPDLGSGAARHVG